MMLLNNESAATSPDPKVADNDQLAMLTSHVIMQLCRFRPKVINALLDTIEAGEFTVSTCRNSFNTVQYMHASPRLTHGRARHLLRY